MRKDVWLAATAAIFLLPATGLCQQQDAQPQESSASQGQSQTGPQAQPAPPAEEAPLAAAARRARDQKKDASKPAKVFDNDNIPTRGGVSTVGNSSSASSTGPAGGDSAASPAGGGGAAAGKGEKQWRQKFADLRHKLEADQTDLDVMQRELSQLDIQYYSDPVKGMQQGLTRSDINDKTAKIDAMKKQIQADQQAISDAEDELRKSGGDSGWAR
jgi:hypothetical protein